MSCRKDVVIIGLQLWLPLNGDIKNYGLCNAELSYGNLAFEDSGKIGKCLSTGGIVMSADTTGKILNNNTVTISLWLYVNAPTGSDNRAMIFGNGQMGNNDNRKFSLFQYPTCNDFHYSWMNDAPSVFDAGLLTNVLPSYQWTHIAVTYDNPNICVYINGELKHTSSGVSNSASFHYTTNVIHNSPYHKVNDFRLYDECLSPKQVKYISQAMICHYPMGNVDGKIGGRNLIRNSGKFLLGSSDFSIGQWRIAGNSTMVRSRVDITDPPECCKSVTGAYQAVGKHPPTLNDAECIGMDNFPYLSDCNIGDTCTFSAWARVVGGGENCYFGFSSYMTKSVKGDSYGYDKFLNNYAVDALNPDGSWTHIVIHFKLTASLTNNIYVGFLTGDKNVTVQACAFKLEKGNIVTPYTPAPEDNSQFYDNIIPDISGYQNNATVKDSTCPAWSNDSPRYLGSYRFDGKSQYISGLSPISNDTKEFTISFWVKLNNVPDPMTFYTARKGIGIGVALFFINKNIRFDDNVQSTFNYTYDLSSNKWTHLCVTRNNTSKKLYVNGKLVDSTSKVGDMQNIGQHFTIGSSEGADNGIGTDNFLNGNISDFRIYATALSESDVLNLYQSSASLDSQGNLMLSGEVVE